MRSNQGIQGCIQSMKDVYMKSAINNSDHLSGCFVHS